MGNNENENKKRKKSRHPQKKRILKLVLKSCQNLTNFVLRAWADQNENGGLSFIIPTTVVCRRRLRRFCCCTMGDMEDPATFPFNLIFFTGFE